VIPLAAATAESIHFTRIVYHGKEKFVTLLIADPILGRGGRYAAATQNPPPRKLYILPVFNVPVWTPYEFRKNVQCWETREQEVKVI